MVSDTLTLECIFGFSSYKVKVSSPSVVSHCTRFFLMCSSSKYSLRIYIFPLCLTRSAFYPGKLFPITCTPYWINPQVLFSDSISLLLLFKLNVACPVKALYRIKQNYFFFQFQVVKQLLYLEKLKAFTMRG